MKNKGFTLIEMMVAIGLFTVVVVMGLASIISVYKVHNKNEDQRVIMDSLTFAMEDMVRNLSVGSRIVCPNNKCNNILEISFMPFDGVNDPDDRIIYKFFGGTNTCDSTSRILKKSIDGGLTYKQITPPEVCLNYIESGFLVTGADTLDKIQPRTTIRLSGYINYNNMKTPFNLQTTVSQRMIDYAQ